MPSALPQSLQSQQLSQLYSYGQFRIAVHSFTSGPGLFYAQAPLDLAHLVRAEQVYIRPRP